MVNKTLLKKMAGEVSLPTLGGLLVSYVDEIKEIEEVNDDSLETIAAIDIITSEFKSRKSKPKPKNQEKPPESTSPRSSVQPSNPQPPQQPQQQQRSGGQQ